MNLLTTFFVNFIDAPVERLMRAWVGNLFQSFSTKPAITGNNNYQSSRCEDGNTAFDFDSGFDRSGDCFESSSLFADKTPGDQIIEDALKIEPHFGFTIDFFD